jgi:hypothetical protein
MLALISEQKGKTVPPRIVPPSALQKFFCGVIQTGRLKVEERSNAKANDKNHVKDSVGTEGNKSWVAFLFAVPSLILVPSFFVLFVRLVRNLVLFYTKSSALLFYLAMLYFATAVCIATTAIIAVLTFLLSRRKHALLVSLSVLLIMLPLVKALDISYFDNLPTKPSCTFVASNNRSPTILESDAPQRRLQTDNNSGVIFLVSPGISSSVTALSDDRFVVTWAHYNDSINTRIVWGQRYDASSGSPIGSSFK